MTITAFLKPAGQHMQLLIRVPLVAMNEIQFPVRSNGYIDIGGAGTMLPGVARNWIANSIDIYEGDTRLALPQVLDVRVAMPSDKSFASFDEAMSHLARPQAAELDTYWNQAWIDARLEYPIHSDRSAFSFRPHLAHLGARVTTSLRYLPPDGTVRSWEYLGDPENLRLDPSAGEVAAQFFEWGFGGTIVNTDYLLIVLCLVLPLRQIRAAAPVACGFIGAGALTLFASVAGLGTDELWFAPVIQLLMAVAILIVAAQNMAGGVRSGRRALEALLFGLIFGFDFAFALAARAQYGAMHAATASIAFGAGTIVSLLLVFAALPPV
ncbi:MAG TPA: HupE/UreJ family protein, partial [Bryobacteraceae bacterium]|nr:HupE/UreJ family protein [Bryobacteraceae bacterium]